MCIYIHLCSKFTYHVVNIKPDEGAEVENQQIEFTYHVVNIKPLSELE